MRIKTLSFYNISELCSHKFHIKIILSFFSFVFYYLFVLMFVSGFSFFLCVWLSWEASSRFWVNIYLYKSIGTCEHIFWILLLITYFAFSSSNSWQLSWHLSYSQYVGCRSTNSTGGQDLLISSLQKVHNVSFLLVVLSLGCFFFVFQ